MFSSKATSFWRSCRALALITAGIMLTGAGAYAQRVPRAPVVRPRVVPRVQAPPRPRLGPRANAPLAASANDLPQNWVEQLQEMKPAEQRKFLKNNDRFNSLPPDQQDLIRQRLKAWNSLPLEQRQAILEREQILQQLPPAQRQQVTQSLFPRWQSLPAPRRQVILGKLRELRAMDPTQRNAKLNDEGFLSTLNPDERQMLRDLSNLGDATG